MTRAANRERKLLTLTCTPCQGSGQIARARCYECRGRGTVKLANPFYVAPGERPTWFQLGGGEGWAREVRRQLELGFGSCWSTPQQQRFRDLCALLEPWRVRSRVHTNLAAIAAIAPLVEQARANGGRLMRPGVMSADTGWGKSVLGELLVEIRNRQTLWQLGRIEPRMKNPRFDIARIPDDRLEALIQRHANLTLVDQLRAERARRTAASAREAEAA